MKVRSYSFSSVPIHHYYEFTSVGAKRKVIKGVQFVKINNSPLVYNVVLGDIQALTGKLDDTVITNNKDSTIVLATVGSIVIDFLNHNPHAMVVAEGNTRAKRRLYQLTLSVQLMEVPSELEVYGLCDDKWEKFTKNRRYQALLVKKIKDTKFT